MLNYTMIPAVLLALNEVLKKAGMPSKYCGIVNVVGGIIGGLTINLSLEGGIMGLLAGLSAGGAYSGIKSYESGRHNDTIA